MLTFSLYILRACTYPRVHVPVVLMLLYIFERVNNLKSSIFKRDSQSRDVSVDRNLFTVHTVWTRKKNKQKKYDVNIAFNSEGVSYLPMSFLCFCLFLFISCFVVVCFYSCSCFFLVCLFLCLLLFVCLFILFLFFVYDFCSCLFFILVFVCLFLLLLLFVDFCSCCLFFILVIVIVCLFLFLFFVFILVIVFICLCSCFVFVLIGLYQTLSRFLASSTLYNQKHLRSSIFSCPLYTFFTFEALGFEHFLEPWSLSLRTSSTLTAWRHWGISIMDVQVLLQRFICRFQYLFHILFFLF